MIDQPVRRMIRAAGHAVETALHTPAQPALGLVVIGHGRINDLDHFSLKAAASGAVRAGWAAIRFNFPYRQRGDRNPDHFEALNAVHLAAAEYGLDQLGRPDRPVVMAGKSLAARTAIEAAKGLDRSENAGHIFLGYPLHAPDDFDRLRDKPLLGLTKPTLFVQGGADALCRPDLLDQVRAAMTAPTSLVRLPGLGHGFEPADPEADYSQAETATRIKRAAADFLAELT